MRGLWLLFAVSLAFPLAACGHKGSLKTPLQAERDAAKKEAKKQKRAADAAQRAAEAPAAPEAETTAPAVEEEKQ